MTMFFAQHKIFMTVTVSILLGSVPGCTDKSLSLQNVHGSVEYHGKLLNHGRVTFTPEQGAPGVPAVGEIQPDGSFRMETEEREGAIEGRYHVLVQCREPPPTSGKPQMALLKSLIPEIYSGDGSPLRFEVKPGDNEYAISLK
jgi:hypothetical protein